MAVIGALNVDIGGRADMPLVPGDSIPGQVRMTLGGVGWNIARDCALLGAETAFFSLLGRDGQEPAIREQAARFGVDIGPCRWTDGPNNRYLYICDQKGDVAAAVNDMGLCARMDEALVGRWTEALNGFGAVAVDANLPAGTLAFLAKEVGAPLAADCVSAAKCRRLEPILPRLHTLKANRLEAQTLTGRSRPEDCAWALADAGVRRVVISLGPEGMLCVEDGALLRQEAVPVTVTDATGAGDALTAALTVGLAAGMDMAACAALGAAAAGTTLTSPDSVAPGLAALAI